jgi:hypothetical protein
LGVGGLGWILHELAIPLIVARATITHFQEVWRTKVPPKIKVFLWQIIRGRLPSGE